MSSHRSYEHAAKAARHSRAHHRGATAPGARNIATASEGRYTIRYAGLCVTHGTFANTTCHRCGGSGHFSDG